MSKWLTSLGILLVGLLLARDTFAQPVSYPVQDVRQVWMGREPKVRVAEIALRVAPILWFTPEEPHILRENATPMVLPCDARSESPVVYYRRTDANSTSEWLTMEHPRLELEYYFYYLHDYGSGCHSNDLESATMTLSFRRVDNAGTTFFAVSLDLLVGAAHGSDWYENRLDLTKEGAEDMSLPPTLLVEEGKHAVAPDRNADGQYTPGYDVNDSTNDAWGVRDVMGSGYFWGNAYRAELTKPRHGTNRVMVDAQSRQQRLWSSSYNSLWWGLPTKKYSLRKLPEACTTYSDSENPEPHGSCKARTVDHFLRQKGIQSRSRWSRFAQRALEDLSQWQARAFFGTSVMGRTLGIHPVVPIRALPVGWLNFDFAMYFSLVEDEDEVRTIDASREKYFRPKGEFGASYRPSMSRPVEWYIGAGFAQGLSEVTAEELAEYKERSRNADGSEVVRTPGLGWVGFAEGGLEFRWHPHFVVGTGVRYYEERGFAPVVRLGLGLRGFSPG